MNEGLGPSKACDDLVLESEGCRLVTYDDARPNHVLTQDDTPEGTLTIGSGHTGPEVVIGLTWTQEQADLQRATDISIACQQMLALVKVDLTQGQCDALTDFVFNMGSKRLAESTLLRVLNMAQYKQVPYELYHKDADGTQHGWILAGGKILPGLVTRRKAEIELWEKP